MKPEQAGLLRDLAQAREQWQAARSYFNNAVEPAAVDHAILLLEAAERRYTTLLKEARAKGRGRDTLA